MRSVLLNTTHMYAIAALVFPLLVTGSHANYNILSALAPQTSTIARPSPGSFPTSTHPALTSVLSHAWDGLELRQVPGFAPVAAPPPEIGMPVVNPLIPTPPAPANPPDAAPPVVVPPAADLPVAPAPALAAPTNPALLVVHPAPPAAVAVSPITPTKTGPLAPLGTGDDFVSVQWVETHIGTLHTWVPKTITFHFAAMSPGPLPGMGAIGMGTLTGETGHTQTIYMVGAAPTPAADLKKGFAAAVAVGIAGLVV